MSTLWLFSLVGRLLALYASGPGFESSQLMCFLAHLSRRLIGELIV